MGRESQKIPYSRDAGNSHFATTHMSTNQLQIAHCLLRGGQWKESEGESLFLSPFVLLRPIDLTQTGTRSRRRRRRKRAIHSIHVFCPSSSSSFLLPPPVCHRACPLSTMSSSSRGCLLSLSFSLPLPEVVVAALVFSRRKDIVLLFLFLHGLQNVPSFAIPNLIADWRRGKGKEDRGKCPVPMAFSWQPSSDGDSSPFSPSFTSRLFISALQL